MKWLPTVLCLSLIVGGCASQGDSAMERPTSTPSAAPGTNPTMAASQDPRSAGGDPVSTLPPDVETYYKTMVFIHGTAQLMAKIDVEAIFSSDNQAAMLPLLTMPGVMDDRVIAAQRSPAPAGLEAAWDKATDAEAGLTQALQDVLMMVSQEDFLRAVTSHEALASAAVAEAESILASQYGASADEIAAAHRAALTEMGEAYKAFASMILAGQSQVTDEP